MDKILINQYPQLHLICWNRDEDRLVTPEEALSLYERNWKYVDESALSDDEKALIDRLVEKHGNGILNV